MLIYSNICVLKAVDWLEPDSLFDAQRKQTLPIFRGTAIPGLPTTSSSFPVFQPYFSTYDVRSETGHDVSQDSVAVATEIRMFMKSVDSWQYHDRRRSTIRAHGDSSD